jgi:pilus assembly protein Flp/PilA
MKTFFNRFAGSDRGASMVEYGLMVALVALIAIPAVAMVGHETEDTFNNVAESLAAGEGGDNGDESPAPGDDDEPPADPGSEAVVASTNSSFFWWNSSKNGGEGAWKATVIYQNDHNRHQYLALEITRTDDKGKTTTSTVKEFYVPANGKATYELWDNSLKLNNDKTTGVVSVEVKVVSVTTADEKWQSVTYPQYGKPTTVDAPKP